MSNLIDQLKSKARSLENAGDHATAAEKYFHWAAEVQEAVEKEEGYFKAASCYEKAKNYEMAIEAYSGVIEQHLEWEPGAYLNRGNAYKSLGNLEQALEDYRSCGETGLKIGNKRHAAMGFHNWGQPLYNSGKVEEARAAWELSYKADKSYANTVMDLAEVYLVTGKTSKALNVVKSGLKADLNSAHRAILLMLQCLAVYFNPKGVDQKVLHEAERQLKAASGAMNEKPQFAVKYIKQYLKADKDQQQYIKKITSFIR